MSYCVQCGSSVPDAQNVCSMCYGDIDYGRDGYYREWAERQMREQQEHPDAAEAGRATASEGGG